MLCLSYLFELFMGILNFIVCSGILVMCIYLVLQGMLEHLQARRCF